MHPILSIIIAILFVLLIAFFIKRTLENIKKREEYREIMDSYRTNYNQSYEKMAQDDPNFNQEIEKIYDLIANKKSEDLHLIAKESKCSITECVMKIRYLMSTKRLDYYYIDHKNGIIKKCSKDDEKKLIQYSKYIYEKRYQINQIASHLQPRYKHNYNWSQLLELVYNDIKYLVDNNLINMIKIDEETKKIIYPKKGNDLISIACPSCGAINDVNRGREKICKYCESIIKGE